jgi:small redox-active disulfide protein 2
MSFTTSKLASVYSRNARPLCDVDHTLVRQVVGQSGIQADVQKVSDIQAMAKAGVLLTPAIAVNGVVKAAGRIPSESEIRSWISGS